jgi:teichuronic acid biosynthesis glycosyltransferase TuaC
VRRLAYARPRRWQFLSQTPGAPDALAAAPWRLLPALAYAARLTLELRRRRANYAAIASHWLVPSAFAARLAAPDLPHLAIAHGSDVALLRGWPGGRRLVAQLSSSGADVVFVSHALAALGGAEHGRVQPMGVEVAAVSGGDRASARMRLALPGPGLLFLGRLVPLKRPVLAVEVAARVPGATLLLAGSGPEASAVEASARVLGVPVRLLGWVDAETRRALLAAADVLVLPTGGRGEGLPVAALEAIAAGLPVVATRRGGCLDLPRYGGAVWLSGDDPDALAQAVRAALAAGRVDEATRQREAAALDWSAVLPNLLGKLGNPRS